MDKSDLELARANKVRNVGTVMAMCCVMGLVGAIWLHLDSSSAEIAGTALSAPAATSEFDFLRAPATVSGVRSAEEVFGARADSPEGEIAPPPTF
jgi:hypothetical protein